MGGTILETESERLIRKGMEQGLSQGIQQGLSQGMNQGQDRILTLNNILLSQNRIEDLHRATTDADYRNHLLGEYGIL